MAKVLVIDDDGVLRRAIARILTRANHHVIEAENGLEGIRKFHAETPDIVILDIVMPHQDGIQTIQEIRDHGPKTGVIAISGGGVRAGELFLTVALDLGADAVIQKPVRAAELIAAIDKVLNRSIAPS